MLKAKLDKVFVVRGSPVGAGQDRYQSSLVPCGFCQGFVILLPKLAELAVFQQATNV